MSERNRTLRIRVKKLLVAIMSVLMILTLVTTISFTLPPAVFAEGEEEAASETAETEESAETAEAEGTEDKAAGNDQQAAEGEATPEQTAPAAGAEP